MGKILNEEEIALLKKQGLAEDIRNKLSPIKNYVSMREDIGNIPPEKAEDMRKLILTERTRAKECIAHILATLEYDLKHSDEVRPITQTDKMLLREIVRRESDTSVFFWKVSKASFGIIFFGLTIYWICAFGEKELLFPNFNIWIATSIICFSISSVIVKIWNTHIEKKIQAIEDGFRMKDTMNRVLSRIKQIKFKLIKFS